MAENIRARAISSDAREMGRVTNTVATSVGKEKRLEETLFHQRAQHESHDQGSGLVPRFAQDVPDKSEGQHHVDVEDVRAKAIRTYETEIAG